MTDWTAIALFGWLGGNVILFIVLCAYGMWRQRIEARRYAQSYDPLS